MKTCNREFITTSRGIVYILPVLIAGLGLVLAGRVAAQTYTWGPVSSNTPSASITYDPGTGLFQYTDVANVHDDDAALPLNGTAAAFITASTGWTALLTVNLSARPMTATSTQAPRACY